MTEENNIVNIGSEGPYTTSMTREEARIRKRFSRAFPEVTFEIEPEKTKDGRLIGRTIATSQEAFKQYINKVEERITPHRIKKPADQITAS